MQGIKDNRLDNAQTKARRKVLSFNKNLSELEVYIALDKVFKQYILDTTGLPYNAWESTQHVNFWYQFRQCLAKLVLKSKGRVPVCFKGKHLKFDSITFDVIL